VTAAALPAAAQGVVIGENRHGNTRLSPVLRVHLAAMSKPRAMVAVACAAALAACAHGQTADQDLSHADIEDYDFDEGEDCSAVEKVAVCPWHRYA